MPDFLLDVLYHLMSIFVNRKRGHMCCPEVRFPFLFTVYRAAMLVWQAKFCQRIGRNAHYPQIDVRAIHESLVTKKGTSVRGAIYKKPRSFDRGLCWHYLSSREVTLQVLSAKMSLTSVFGMGTGGPSSQSIPTM